MDIVQIPTLGGRDREVAQRGELEPGDLVIALGGDGTVLSALHAAAPHDAAVLGVACGSLAALTAVPGAISSTTRWNSLACGRLDAAPDFQRSRSIPRMGWTCGRSTTSWSPAAELDSWLSTSQSMTSSTCGSAGDGLIVATPLGSSAYSMAAGGPLVALGTPRCRVHATGDARRQRPAARRPNDREVWVEGPHPASPASNVESRVHTYPLEALEYRLSLDEFDKVTLVSFGQSLASDLKPCESGSSSATARASWHATIARRARPGGSEPEGDRAAVIDSVPSFQRQGTS